MVSPSANPVTGIVIPEPPASEVGYLPLDDLLAHVNPDNPKDHDIGDIMLSIQRFGFVGHVTFDPSVDMLVGGHGRAKTLAAMRDDGQNPPLRIVTDPGDEDIWLVPTHFKVFPSDHERNAFTVADNQTTIKGGWEAHKLVATLSNIATADPVRGLDGTGFDGDDLDDLMAQLNGGEGTSEGYGGGEKVREANFGVLCTVPDADTERAVQVLLTSHGYSAKRLSSGS